MEIELKGEPLHKMMNDFDFDAYQAAHPESLGLLPEALLNSYLDNFGNLERLPRELRDSLMKDLNPRKRDRDLEEVKRRWRALSTASRAPHVRLRGFTNAQLETLMIPAENVEGFNPAIHVEKLELKVDMDSRAREAYDGLEWVRDGDTVEYRHKVPMTDLNSYLDQVETFGDRAGISGRLARPTKGELVSYHNHLSVMGVGDVAQKVRADNVAAMIEAVSKGFGGALKEDIVAYNAVEHKGLVRLHGSNRKETRFTLQSPGESLESSLRSLGEDGYAIDVMQRTIDERLDAKVLRAIVSTPGLKKLDLFLGDLQKLEPELTRSREIFGRITQLLPEALEGVSGDLKGKVFRRIVAAATTPRAAAGIASGLEKLASKGMLKEFQFEFIGSHLSKTSDGGLVLARLLEFGDVQSQRSLLIHLSLNPHSWDTPLWSQMLDLLETDVPRIKMDVEQLMEKQGLWPDFAIRRVLRSPNTKPALRMLERYPAKAEAHIDDLRMIQAQLKQDGFVDSNLNKLISSVPNRNSSQSKGCVTSQIAPLSESLSKAP
jgi:hypothetical protein